MNFSYCALFLYSLTSDVFAMVFPYEQKLTSHIPFKDLQLSKGRNPHHFYDSSKGINSHNFGNNSKHIHFVVSQGLCHVSKIDSTVPLNNSIDALFPLSLIIVLEHHFRYSHHCWHLALRHHLFTTCSYRVHQIVMIILWDGLKNAITKFLW